MINSIPFSIPAEFAVGLSDGSLIRIGTLLKESATGKIVAHVQETGLAQQLLSGIGIPHFSPLTAASECLNLASSGYANVQLAQLKTMVEGLQTLQFANLGISVAGIGVSAIGFAMINKRLKGIEDQISDLDKKIDRHFQGLFDFQMRQHYSRVSALFEKAELAYTLTNSSDEWRGIASQLADESGFFRGEIVYLLEQNTFDADLFTALVRSIALCNAGRIACLLSANELPAAYNVANIIGQNYKEIFTPYHHLN